MRLNNPQDVDHVVIGLGGLGSAAAYWLARTADQAGRSHPTIVGLEQYHLGHDRGASHDHSRIIRRSYHTAGYAALASGAYEAWDAVAAEAGEELAYAPAASTCSLLTVRSLWIGTRTPCPPSAARSK